MQNFLFFKERYITLLLYVINDRQDEENKEDEKESKK